MSVRTENRRQTVAMYEELGLHVFPYDSKGLPFRDYPSEFLMNAPLRRDIALQSTTSTFGVNLSGRIVVIDIDANRGGSLEDLEEMFGELPPTMTVVTPSSDENLHLYFRVEGEPLRTSKKLTQIAPHIDFLGYGSHVKGATSWRRLDRIEDDLYEASSYHLQRPYLKPAILPESIEAAWRESAIKHVEELYEYDLGTPQKLTRNQRQRINRWIKQSLAEIEAAEDGNRYEVMSRAALSVYRNGAILGTMDAYDSMILDAYEASGGTDSWVLAALQRTKAYAATVPKPAPRLNSYSGIRSAEIAEWADFVPNTNKSVIRQKLVAAIAAETNTDLVMTTSLDVLNAKYKIGSKAMVYREKDELIKDGYLMKTGSAVTLKGFEAHHHRLIRN